jgi:hypothetical protein
MYCREIFITACLLAGRRVPVTADDFIKAMRQRASEICSVRRRPHWNLCRMFGCREGGSRVNMKPDVPRSVDYQGKNVGSILCLPENENRPMFRDVCTIQLLLIHYNIFTRHSELDHLSWPVSGIPNTGAPRRIIIYATSSLQDSISKGQLRNLRVCRCSLDTFCFRLREHFPLVAVSPFSTMWICWQFRHRPFLTEWRRTFYGLEF